MKQTYYLPFYKPLILSLIYVTILISPVWTQEAFLGSLLKNLLNPSSFSDFFGGWVYIVCLFLGMTCLLFSTKFIRAKLNQESFYYPKDYGLAMRQTNRNLLWPFPEMQEVKYAEIESVYLEEFGPEKGTIYLKRKHKPEIKLSTLNGLSLDDKKELIEKLKIRKNNLKMMEKITKNE